MGGLCEERFDRIARGERERETRQEEMGGGAVLKPDQ